MYSNEDRMKVMRLYIEYDYNARAVIRELGYPSRNRLAIWYKEYQKHGTLDGLKLTPKKSMSILQKALHIVPYFWRYCRIL